MAFTRKFLKAMGIEDEKIEQIIEAHVEVTSALKDEIQKNEDKVEEYDKLKKDYEKLYNDAKNSNSEDYKGKYDLLKKEYDNYKNEIKSEKEYALKETAYRNILKDAGISEKRINSILKLSKEKIASLEMEGDKVTNSDSIKKDAEKEWEDFIETNVQKGAVVETPMESTNTEKDPFEIGFDEG